MHDNDQQRNEMARYPADAINADPAKKAKSDTPKALVLARKFHDNYERLAPRFGYETRDDTKQFEPDTPNGRLMTAVCSEILSSQQTDDPLCVTNAPTLSNETIQRITAELSDRLIQRMDLDEEDPRLFMIIDELRDELTALGGEKA